MFRAALVVSAAALGGSAALAGGISSSGGAEHIADRANPWFLQNTPEVHYCIAHDLASFSLPLTEVRAKIRSAFDYWAKQMQSSEVKPGPYLPPNQTMRVGTQVFREVACSEEVDLRFQLGVLSDEQKRLVDSDLSKVVGHAERTAYDPVQLKGRGFIYVAADHGSNFTTPSAVPERAWSWNEGYALYAILTHEVGHIFGLFDAAQSSDVMSYLFAEQIMTLVSRYPNEHTPLSLPDTVKVLRNMHPGVDACLPNESLAQRAWEEAVLGLPMGASPCIATHYQNGTLQLLGGPSPALFQVLGEAKLSETVDNGEVLVSVWLPPEQQVFKRADQGQGQGDEQREPVVYQKIITAKGFYQSFASHHKTEIYLDLDPAKKWPPKILGIVGSAIQDLCQYRADGNGPLGREPGL